MSKKGDGKGSMNNELIHPGPAVKIEYELIQLEPELEMKSEPEIEIKSEPEVEMKIEPEIEIISGPEIEIKSEPEVEMKIEPEIEIISEPEIEIISEPEVQIKCEPVCNEPKQVTESEGATGPIILVDVEQDALIQGAIENLSAKGYDYLPWNDYFMSLCYLISAASRHPVTKVGACIISQDNKVISAGVNGMPNGIDESLLSWEETESSSAAKNPYVVHAAVNAIMNGKYTDFGTCKMYITQFPCPECAKLIIQAGIKQVFYAEKRKSLTTEIMIPTTKMFDLAGVSLKYFEPSIKKLKIDLHNASTTLIKMDEDCNI